MLLGALCTVAAAQTPDFIYVGANAFVETQWGGLGCPTCPVQNPTESTSQAAVASWTSTISTTTMGYASTTSGTYEGFVSCGGDTVVAYHSLDYTYTFTGGFYIHSMSGSSQVDVYALAAPGTDYTANVMRLADATGQNGNMSSSSFASAFGSSFEGQESMRLTTTNQTTVFNGATYSYLGRVEAGASCSGGQTCIIGCPSYVNRNLVGVSGAVVSFTPFCELFPTPPEQQPYQNNSAGTFASLDGTPEGGGRLPTARATT